MSDKQWIAIVDMDQPDNRRPLVITDPDDNPVTFDSYREIRKLAIEHPLGVFSWWAVNFATGRVEVI